MLKVIDLDSQGKDVDGFVFTLTIGDARFGVTDQEVAELIRSKYASGKGGAKRPNPKKSQSPETAAAEALASGAPEGEVRTSPDLTEAAH
jgi:topoisomerase IA-like protein